MEKIKVLMIDDNVNLVEMVNDYFEDNPRIDIVGSAYNGDEGLKIIKEGKLEYDLIVLDLIMPKKDGIAVLRDLKENNINRNIIVATSYNAPDTIRKVSEYGVTYYILKPFDLPDLEDKILVSDQNDFSKKIIVCKKEILRYYHYYGQLLDMIDTLVEKYTDMKQIFKTLSEKINRLQSETLLLREYTHQLQDLYESQISLHQNNVMKVLTIVTTIFLPLTLITGWYGMNFKYMPEIYWKMGYPLMIIIFGVIIAAFIICLIIFKKKKFW